MMMNSEAYPTHLEKSADRQLILHWSDGLRQCIPFRALRDACPCANCKEHRLAEASGKPAGQLPVLSAEQLVPLDISHMSPVGNYAYNIVFNDGHSSGIFTFELLRSFSQ
jgi:DUF971 family protein